jgi:hypothetical protein
MSEGIRPPYLPLGYERRQTDGPPLRRFEDRGRRWLWREIHALVIAVVIVGTYGVTTVIWDNTVAAERAYWAAWSRGVTTSCGDKR